MPSACMYAYIIDLQRDARNYEGNVVAKSIGRLLSGLVSARTSTGIVSPNSKLLGLDLLTQVSQYCDFLKQYHEG